MINVEEMKYGEFRVSGRAKRALEISKSEFGQIGATVMHEVRQNAHHQSSSQPDSQPFATRTIRPNAENERDICLLLVATVLIPLGTESRKN